MDFNWVIKDSLAGSDMPGLMNELEEDIVFLKKMNINLIITLTEAPLNPCVSEFGFKLIHFPILDMGFPMPRPCQEICNQAVESINNKLPVLFHCKAGQGRTGLMLACTLVSLGQSPEEALSTVRKVNRAYVQTNSQESFITNYFQFLSKQLITI
jgi:atypical dual specificity phosphatase